MLHVFKEIRRLKKHIKHEPTDLKKTQKTTRNLKYNI